MNIDPKTLAVLRQSSLTMEEAAKAFLDTFQKLPKLEDNDPLTI